MTLFPHLELPKVSWVEASWAETIKSSSSTSTGGPMTPRARNTPWTVKSSYLLGAGRSAGKTRLIFHLPRYPLELHVVHTKVGDPNPVYNPKGLSVTGFFFELDGVSLVGLVCEPGLNCWLSGQHQHSSGSPHQRPLQYHGLRQPGVLRSCRVLGKLCLPVAPVAPWDCSHFSHYSWSTSWSPWPLLMALPEPPDTAPTRDHSPLRPVLNVSASSIKYVVMNHIWWLNQLYFSGWVD